MKTYINLLRDGPLYIARVRYSYGQGHYGQQLLSTKGLWLGLGLDH